MPIQEFGQCRKCGGDISGGMDVDGLCEECLLRLYRKYLKSIAELIDASVQAEKKASPTDEAMCRLHLPDKKYSVNRNAPAFVFANLVDFTTQISEEHPL